MGIDVKRLQGIILAGLDDFFNRELGPGEDLSDLDEWNFMWGPEENDKVVFDAFYQVEAEKPMRRFRIRITEEP